MKKTLFIVATILSIVAGVKPANAAQVPQRFTTCPTVFISSTSLEVSSNTASLSTSAEYYHISVINLSTAPLIYCSDDLAVSTWGAHIGVPVVYYASTTAQGFGSWDIGQLEPWYCAAGDGGTNAKVCKTR